jgi:hypothetical protein
MSFYDFRAHFLEVRMMVSVAEIYSIFTTVFARKASQKQKETPHSEFFQILSVLSLHGR